MDIGRRKGVYHLFPREESKGGSRSGCARQARKGVLATLAVLVLLVGCGAPHSASPRMYPEEAERPNIVFIMADDLGYGDVGAYGQTQIHTPNLDRMAAEGMRFTAHSAGSPVCAPSRSALMTGLHTGHTTIRGNTGSGGVVDLAGKPGRIPLRDEDATVAEVLRAAGYTTGLVGKWGLGEPGTSDLLEEFGLAENTLVFFTSDNGPHDRDGHDPAYFGSSGSFRGIKGELYEGGIRVPLIVRWPDRIAAGSENEHPSAFWDFLPTAAEIAGAEAPSGIDGISYVPALLGRKQPRHDHLYWEFHRGGFQQAVRMGRWKAVRLELGQPIEFYDLEADPGETTDLSGAHPDLVQRAAELFEGARTESPFFPLPGERGGSKR